MQMKLSFIEIPKPCQPMWEELDEEHRHVVIDRLSRLITKAALAPQMNEEDTDD